MSVSAKQPTTVITGGAGFLGSHLSDRFIAEGHRVIGIDNFVTGSPDNIAHLVGNPNYLFIQHDVTNFIYVDGKVDNVLHFASPASPIDYLKLPIQTLKVGSLGTHKALGFAKAKGARFMIASTSEVYGDPHIHPQDESYWGNVNPIGMRGVYDEAKRFAEAMTMAYHRYHGLDTRILRIFNSILSDELVCVFDEGNLHLGSVESVWDKTNPDSASPVYRSRTLLVPAFGSDGTVELRTANAFIKHTAEGKDAFLVKTRYGRSIKVTGDHSVFTMSADGLPVAKPVRALKVGEHLAILGKLPVVEKDRACVDLSKHLLQHGSDTERWAFALHHDSLRESVQSNKARLIETLATLPRFAGSRSPRNTAGCTVRKFIQTSTVPVAVIEMLGESVLPDAFEHGTIQSYRAASKPIKNRVKLTPDLLWLFGLYLAEGTSVSKDGDYYLSLASDDAFVQRAKTIFETELGCSAATVVARAGRSPQVYSHSKPLVYLFTKVLGLPEKTKSAFIPRWLMQLPLSRLKYFLEGYKDGDGTHTGKKVGNELCFDTVSERLAQDLTYLLLRFGIVASVGKYQTTFKQKYGDRKFDFHRLTICEVDDFNILNWDTGVRQTLNAKRFGDLVWAKITDIQPAQPTEYVYDFSVNEFENFVAGTGVMAHNTYGEKMRLDDGRALPSFVGSAIRGESMNVFGDGSQTRSFCYVSDLVDGIWRLLHAETHEPVNIGNPAEISILDFAKEVQSIMKDLTGNSVDISFKPLPADDPKQRKPDITRATTLLGWSPKIDRAEGLRRTIKYFVELEAKKKAVV